MKKINIATFSIVIGILIWVLVIVLSYVHSTEWFHRAGYGGWLAHLGVCAFEGTFLFGTLVVIWSMFSGVQAGWRSQLFFYLGVLFNFYANISSGVAKGHEQLVFGSIKGVIIDESVLIGFLISVLAIGTKLIVTDAIAKWRIINGMVEELPATTEQKTLTSQLKNWWKNWWISNTYQADIDSLATENGNRGSIATPTITNDVLDLVKDESEAGKTEVEQPINKAYQVAKKIFDDGGSIGRVKLAREAGVNTNQARQALELIKTES